MMNCRRIEQRSLAFLIVVAFLFNAICGAANDQDGDVDDDTVLTIAQSCAPKSRSRRAITVDRMTMTCAENDEQSPTCSVGSFAQVAVDCECHREAISVLLYARHCDLTLLCSLY